LKKVDFPDSPENKEMAKEIIELGNDDASLLLNAVSKYNKEVHNKIKTLWNDKGIQEAFSHREKFHIFDGCTYYFSKLDALAPPNYQPSLDDILYCRKKNNWNNRITF